MPDLSSLFPYVLATHISLAIALFVPNLLLPFTLRNRLVNHGYAAQPPGRFVRLMLARQEHGTIVIGAGLALTAVVAFVIQRPTLRRLAHRDRIRSDEDREAWRAKARRQRYIAYGITSAVGLIAFLMSTKPVLW